jgi:hypothetical protein
VDNIRDFHPDIPEPAPYHQIASRSNSNADSENCSAKSNPKRKRLDSTGDDITASSDADKDTGRAPAGNAAAQDEDERARSPEESTEHSTEDVYGGVYVLFLSSPVSRTTAWLKGCSNSSTSSGPMAEQEQSLFAQMSAKRSNSRRRQSGNGLKSVESSRFHN